MALGKTRKPIPLALLVALGLLLAGTVSAQELRGRLIGEVKDNTGAALPGVTVTASGSAVIQPQTTTTGEDGS